MTAPKKTSSLDRLKADEAATVLRLLLKKHPDLTKEVEMLAKSVIGDVSIEDVADAVEDEVRSLDLEDLNSRAGSHAHGYVEPSEAAWELVEEAVTPFLDDIKRRAEAGQTDAALTQLPMWVGVFEASAGENLNDFAGRIVETRK